jgi:Ca-activated chloride channel family protein
MSRTSTQRLLSLSLTTGVLALVAACGATMQHAPEGDYEEAVSSAGAGGDASQAAAADAPAPPVEADELAEAMPMPSAAPVSGAEIERRQAAPAKRKTASTRASRADLAPPPPPAPRRELQALGYLSAGPAEAEAADNGRARNRVADSKDDAVQTASPAGGATAADRSFSVAVPEAEPAPDADQPLDVIAQANTEEFTDHGINPFTLVSDDPLSTFSIDVDTASYAISRRKLRSGALPPEAAVRVEEFVNYFDYESYVTPQDDPFAVNMEAMPDPFRPGHHILRVGVQGKEVSRSERPPLHLTFLVDVSGSMSSKDKLPMAQRSMHMLVDTLREDDTVALATYAGRVARILEPTSAGNKRQIHDAIQALNSGGSTAMSAGIDIAYDMAAESFQEGHENRVIVLSDGDANVGNTSFDAMLSQIKGHADRGVTLTTIGLGMGNYRDTLMEQLANKGDGNNYYIDSQDMAQRVFVEEMGGAMLTIARDVKLQVEFNPESVAAYRLIGYENRDVADKDFRNDRVDAGEVGSGHNVTALYDVVLKEGYERELATVRMRYERPGADKGLTGEGATEKLWVFADRALKETPFQATRDTRIAYSAATFAEILRGSPEADELDLGALIRFAQKSSRRGEKDDVELIELMKRAQALGAGTATVAAR